MASTLYDYLYEQVVTETPRQTPASLSAGLALDRGSWSARWKRGLLAAAGWGTGWLLGWALGSQDEGWTAALYKLYNGYDWRGLADSFGLDGMLSLSLSGVTASLLGGSLLVWYLRREAAGQP